MFAYASITVCGPNRKTRKQHRTPPENAENKSTERNWKRNLKTLKTAQNAPGGLLRDVDCAVVCHKRGVLHEVVNLAAPAQS